jgi:hypothetical protein
MKQQDWFPFEAAPGARRPARTCSCGCGGECGHADEAQELYLFEAPPRIGRPVQRRSSFTSSQVRGAFRDAQRLGTERVPPRTTVRTERSERARHRDQLRGTDAHHAFPKYLGGLKRQLLVHLPKDLHYLYHQEVDKILKLPRTRSGVYRQLSRADRVDILRRMANHAALFDTRYGTAIMPHMRAAVRAAFRAGVL